MFLPLFFKTGLSCLLVGGGKVASHKLGILLDAACRITVIAPEISGSVAEEIQKQSVTWLKREYAEGDCKGYQLVIAATPFKDVNRRISVEAGLNGTPVNVVDDPELSTVIFPAIWRDCSLSLAVSTGGVAPFMAAEIRSLLGRHARGMGQWVEAGGKFRETVKQEVAGTENRNILYRKFLDAGIPDALNTPPDSSKLRDWLSWLDSMKEPEK